MRSDVKLRLPTFFPSLRDDVSSALAHDAGHIEGTVGLAGDGDGTEHSLRLQLQTRRGHGGFSPPKKILSTTANYGLQLYMLPLVFLSPR